VGGAVADRGGAATTTAHDASCKHGYYYHHDHDHDHDYHHHHNRDVGSDDIACCDGGGNDDHYCSRCFTVISARSY
jgi:hypothetical protein